MHDFTGNPPPSEDGGAIWPAGPDDQSGVPGVPIVSGAQRADDGADNAALDLLINYNEKFRNAGPTLFREQIVRQMAGVLIGKNKPNCLLVGPAGTGKTKIVEDLAWRLENADPTMPDRLKGNVIYELPLSNIVAGSSLVGQLEGKLKTVMDFLVDDPSSILFIDEIHQLCGDSQTYGKIAQIIKPYLARGDIRLIGATTSQEANLLMDDPALNRRFSRIIVDEFTQEQTVEILKAMKGSFFLHYDKKPLIDDALLETVVKLADQYRPAGSHRPDNAITLLDRAIGEAMVGHKIMLKNAQSNPTALQALQAIPHIVVTMKNVKQTAIRLMTGNAKKNDFDMDHMRAAMSVIRGQDEAVEKTLDKLRKHDMALFPSNKPLTFLFTGMSGVGKTAMANIVAQELTGVKPVILNMTEYHDSASINRIVGAPAGYVGSDSNAELPFDCLESNPYQVILLDEFEKSDKSVQRLFMSAFDDGCIKTSRGKTVDFSKSIIIATTNAGNTNDAKRSIGFGDGSDARENLRDTVKSLANYFDIELLNRFREIVHFNPLDKSVYRDIVQDYYRREKARLAAERPKLVLPDVIPDDELDELVERTYVPEFGARPVANAVQDYIENHA